MIVKQYSGWKVHLLTEKSEDGSRKLEDGRRKSEVRAYGYSGRH
jgi:hypothetical protein